MTTVALAANPTSHAVRRTIASVVPDSGSGELAGLSGTMAIEIADGQHSYRFEYRLETSG